MNMNRYYYGATTTKRQFSGRMHCSLLDRVLCLQIKQYAKCLVQQNADTSFGSTLGSSIIYKRIDIVESPSKRFWWQNTLDACILQ